MAKPNKNQETLKKTKKPRKKRVIVALDKLNKPYDLLVDIDKILTGRG